MTNLEIVNQMVKEGYALMNRTAEEMAETFTTAQLMSFLESFRAA